MTNWSQPSKTLHSIIFLFCRLKSNILPYRENSSSGTDMKMDIWWRKQNPNVCWLPRSHRLNHLSASELTLFYLLSWGNTAHTGLGFFFQVDNASSQLHFPKGLLAKCKSCQTKAQRETLVLVMFSLCHTDQGYYFLLKQMRNKNYLSSIVLL